MYLPPTQQSDLNCRHCESHGLFHLDFLILCRAGEESEKLSQEDCFQLLIQAQEILRKEYIQKQNKAREEIEKR